MATAGFLAVALLCSGVVTARDNISIKLRDFIDQQVGGIEKLMVPADTADLPQSLLLDGIAGEPDETDGGLNSFGHPAQENLTLLLDAHRMLSIVGP